MKIIRTISSVLLLLSFIACDPAGFDNGNDDGGQNTETPDGSDPDEAVARVGDPGAGFDTDLIDALYRDQMEEWMTAGVEGGIPFLENQLKSVDMTFEAGTDAETIDAYFKQNVGKTVLLKNGEYTFGRNVALSDGSVLIGESRDGVKITMCGEASSAIDMRNLDNAGVRNLTLTGGWSETAPDPTNMSEVLAGKGGWKSIDMSGNTVNCYADNIKILNSASHPIWIAGSHNTVRDMDIDGAYCKGGGAQGYFFIDGDHQLITGCKVTHIRHVSMQNTTSTLNVFYGNDMRQEFSFHVNDGGDNLIENNRITIPSTLSGYTAIMGPWSLEHQVGGRNFIYRNDCIEENHPEYGFNTPWSDDSLYIGPYEIIHAGEYERLHNNFRTSAAYPAPKGKTFYPIILK